MPWLQLTISVSDRLASEAEQALENLGALSVSVDDAGDQPLLEPMPGETRLWRHNRVTGLFDHTRDAQLLRAALQNALPAEVCDTLETEILQDQVWERAWLKDFHPMRFGRRLWVCPAGQRPDQSAAAVVVDLDPGLAFGTGTHPSTALCLEWLDGMELNGKRVLDFGCGSGILAVAAALLGADTVTALDHDPQALEATADNAGKNGVGDRVRVLAPGEAPQGPFDLVLANILAGTLIELAPTIKPLVGAGGQLVLAGILDDQQEAVRAAYRPEFTLVTPAGREEWVLLQGIREIA